MILKIRALDNEAKEAWRIIDDVSDLHYSQYQNVEQVRPSVKVEGVEELRFNDENNATKEALFLSFWSHGTAYVVWTNTATYLLNDTGRTIERLM